MVAEICHCCCSHLDAVDGALRGLHCTAVVGTLRDPGGLLQSAASAGIPSLEVRAGAALKEYVSRQ